jgi:hypothetical protein
MSFEDLNLQEEIVHCPSGLLVGGSRKVQCGMIRLPRLYHSLQLLTCIIDTAAHPGDVHLIQAGYQQRQGQGEPVPGVMAVV